MSTPVQRVRVSTPPFPYAFSLSPSFVYLFTHTHASAHTSFTVFPLLNPPQPDLFAFLNVLSIQFNPCWRQDIISTSPILYKCIDQFVLLPFSLPVSFPSPCSSPSPPYQHHYPSHTSTHTMFRSAHARTI